MHMANGVSVLRLVEEVDNHEIELSKLMQQLEDNHVKDQQPNLVVAALSHVLVRYTYSYKPFFTNE